MKKLQTGQPTVLALCTDTGTKEEACLQNEDRPVFSERSFVNQLLLIRTQ